MIKRNKMMLKNTHITLCERWFNHAQDSKIPVLSKLKAFADGKLNAALNIQVVFIWWKTLLEKEKMLVPSFFSFPDHVYRRLFPFGDQKLSLCGKGLTLHHTIRTYNDPEEEGYPSIFSFSNNILTCHR